MLSLKTYRVHVFGIKIWVISAGASYSMYGARFWSDRKILYDDWCFLLQICVPLPPWAVRAGARKKIYFNPTKVNAAVVTCGGLCPGLNDVVQGIVRKLEDYGVPEGNILGIRSDFCFYESSLFPSFPQLILEKVYADSVILTYPFPALSYLDSWQFLVFLIHATRFYLFLSSSFFLQGSCYFLIWNCCLEKIVRSDLLEASRIRNFES